MKKSTAAILKLSTVKREPRFVKCQKCRFVFENDLNTSHAPCPNPKCGAVMENISMQAAINLKEQWDKEVKSR